MVVYLKDILVCSYKGEGDRADRSLPFLLLDQLKGRDANWLLFALVALFALLKGKASGKVGRSFLLLRPRIISFDQYLRIVVDVSSKGASDSRVWRILEEYLFGDGTIVYGLSVFLRRGVLAVLLVGEK